MKRYFLLLMSFTISLVGCKDPIPAPDAAVLIAPEDNIRCLYVPLNTASANVLFSWQQALNTDDYLLKVRSEATGIETTTITENTSLRLTLDRGQVYSWKVVSRSEASAEETESNSRYFFLEAQQQLSHLPFPAKLVSPEVEEVVDLNNGNVVFSWEGADLDGDISTYNLLLGSSENNLEIIASNLTQSSHSHPLETGSHYYWQVETIDAEGNRSSSIIVYFQTTP